MMLHSNFNRRQFLEFFGYNALKISAGSAFIGAFLPRHAFGKITQETSVLPRIQPHSDDALILAPGIDSNILLKWNDPIAPSGLKFGSENDFCAFIPKDPKNPTDGVLMVNHESVNPLFVSGFSEKSGKAKTRAQVDLEQQSVGVSLVRFFKTPKGSWEVDTKSTLNRRINGKTQIPFSSKFPIEGSKFAHGTFANCAGGTTPWGTFLTCEENYEFYYGEWDYSPAPGTLTKRKSPRRVHPPWDLLWHTQDDFPPAHYGWVVEIDPWSGAAEKLTALGRFCHESATCSRSKNGKAVVYMGDDTANQFLYKFISDEANSLKSGTLYVAQLETGRWIPIRMDSHPEFSQRFENETDLKVRTREAAALLKATPLDRPEDIEINPQNGDVIISLSNNYMMNRAHGSLLKIQEKNADPGSLEFNSSTWLAGGEENGFSCPDNLAFDHSGNLWFTNDIAGEKMNTGEHKNFKNNGLFFIPMRGAEAGKVFQIASAPRDAELTGPMFTPDGETLLISVQHPGDETVDIKKPTSNWPDGPGTVPKSAVVALTGEGLRKLVNYKG